MKFLYITRLILIILSIFLLEFFAISPTKVNAISNCSLNIYPQPILGTHHYIITLTNNASVPGYSFINNYWVDGRPSGGPSNIITSHYNYWSLTAGLGYQVNGTAGVPIANSAITYELDLTFSNTFDGVDIALESQSDNSFDICSQGHGTYDISYDNIILDPTPTPALIIIPTPTPSSCSLNIYPQPMPGTHSYKVTLINNTSVPGYKFINNYWADNQPSGRVSYIGTSDDWYIHAPTVTNISYQITGTAGTPISNSSITYDTELTFSNVFNGVDIALQSQGSPSFDICSQGHEVYAVTFNNLNNLPTPTPILTPTPSPTPILTPTPTPKTPLILIPGVGGSEFKSNEAFSSEIRGCGISPVTFNYNIDDLIWIDPIRAGVSPCDEYLDVLKLQIDGLTPEYPQISLSGNFFEGAYGEFIKFFTNNGYELNKNLFLFPYDWRKDIGLTTAPLSDQINAIKSQTGFEKVDIVAHSMGGLVARNYIADIAKAQNVRKLFTLGTPHLGSVDSLKNLRFGGCLTKSNFFTDIINHIICLGVAPREIKDIIQNMISAYEIAPTQEYFNFYNGQDKNHMAPYLVDDKVLSYDGIKSFLGAIGNNISLFVPSESFHLLDNSLANTNGVEIVNIAGSGLETLGQIIEKSVEKFDGSIVQKKDGFSINGDKTVPLFSASLIDHGSSESLLGNAKVYYTKQDHGELVSSGSALNLVKNILEENSDLPDGASALPYQFSGTQISVHSPVNINVYDQNNNHTGPTIDGNFEANIPGSSYDTLDDAKFIFLPDDGIYDIKFQATGQGSFDFKIRKYDQNAISQETLYKDIPLTTSTKAETQLDTTSNMSPVVHLDENGDGIIRDISSSSNLIGDAVFDQIAPQTNIQMSGVLGKNSWFRSDVTVTLEPQDDASGSGILKTEYSLDDGQTLNIYAGPFTVSTEQINKLKFRSVDNAGNEEDPDEAEIKIDKTAPEAKISVDPDKQDLVVKGIDVNSTIVVKSDNKFTKKKDDAFYLITDEAGNSLKIDVRERDKGKQDRFRIYSIQYNNDSVKKLANNYFNVTYNGKRKRSNVREQSFELEKVTKIRIQYNSWWNKSTIVVKENKKERVKEVRSGLVYLNLLTSKGQLRTSY